jgi:hypothetical protein
VAAPKLIGEFLLELNTNTRKLKRFFDDPDAVLEESGLTPKQQRIVKSGNLRRIRDEIRKEYGSAEYLLYPVQMHIGMPRKAPRSSG